MAPVRKGDGTGLTFQGIAEARKGDGTVLWSAGSDIPDSEVAHWDATELSLSDGESVGTWVDVSGNGRHLSGSGPIYDESGINSNPAIFFDGVDDNFDLLNWDTISQPNEVHAVFQRDGNGTNREYIMYGDNSGEYQILATNYNGGNMIWASSYVEGSSSDTNPHIIGGVFDGSNSEIRFDGAIDTTGNTGSTAQEAIRIGSSNETQWFGGWMGEIIVYDRRLTDSERSDLENYFADKWGISI